MLGSLWNRVRRSYLGQVITAGALLTLASLLMFGVVSTIDLHSERKSIQTEKNDLIQSNKAAALAPVPSSEPKLETENVTAQQATQTNKDTAAGKEAIRDIVTGIVIYNFGWQVHPLYHDWRFHNGIDITGGEGQIVPALMSGEVVDVLTDKQYGLTVVVKSGKYTIYYGSLANVGVHKNSTISAGTPIGSMGISRSELEPHLHLAIKAGAGDEYINPFDVLNTIPR